MRTLGLLILTLSISPFVFHHAASAHQEQVVYVCPMHTDVKSAKPGVCPRCEMKLEAKKGAGGQKSEVGEKSATPGQESGGRVVEAVPLAEGYTCSMHPEVRVNEQGKCPKCGMPLVAVVPAIVDEFDLRVECAPRAPKPNEKVRLRFSVYSPKTGEQAKNFLVMHEQLFHLFIISQDMNHFQHIHPDLQPDGTFTIETVLPQPGRYKVYSDFYPMEGAPQVLQQSIVTAGHASDLFASQAKLAPDTTLVKTADGMKVELKLEPENIIAGQPVALKYHLTDAKTGEPIKDLLPYLGAWGHTLILSEDQSDYVHSHPEESVPESENRAKLKSGPDVTFEALMPRPGVYRIWTQFLRGETLTTVSFTVRAERLR